MGDGDRKRELTHALLERLIHYYHFVASQVEEQQSSTVTSAEIAKLVHTDDTLVRKDLAAIGVRGLPRVGYRSAEVLRAIHRQLGFDQPSQAVVLGAGRLGGALASYDGFDRYGLDICGVFDTDPDKVGAKVGTLTVRPIEELGEMVRRRGISIAVLTVPAEAAQRVATSAVEAGVKAIWNFASTNIVVPDGVFVRHEHIAVGLAELSYLLKSG